LEEQADSSAATTSATAPSSPSNNCLVSVRLFD
jgi:hypothetical protein